MNKLMQESEKKAKIIEHQNLVIKKFKTQSEDFCKKLNIAEDLRKQFIDLKVWMIMKFRLTLIKIRWFLITDLYMI